MAIRAGKEITMIWQGLLVGALSALVIFIFSACCSVIIYLYVRQVELQLLLGFLSAAGLAAITLAISSKFLGQLSFFRQPKTKLKS